MSFNRATLIGHLGRDPEVRRTNAGDPVVSFSIATTEAWRDKQTGERKERTEWHNVVVFNESLANVIEQYCKKGSKIMVEGQIRTRDYEDRDGHKRKATEIVLAKYGGNIVLLGDSKARASGVEDYGTTRTQPAGVRHENQPAGVRHENQPAGARHSMKDIIDDDIPF